MSTNNESSLLSGGKQTRREFITTCSALTAGMFVFPTFISSSFASPLIGSAGSNLNQLPKTKILVLGAHPDPTKPNWPNIDYDFAGDIRQFVNQLKSHCPHVDFSLVTTSDGSKEKAREILSGDR
ncbi:MAG: twin-arginine translocation signal domain-containing protein, partial [Bacteroidales bacterium]